MEKQQAFLLFALLIFFCLPYVLLAFYNAWIIAVTPAGKIDEGPLLKIVKEIASDPAAYTNVIHQMIMPVLAVITAAGRQQILKSGVFGWLFALPLLTVFACLLNAVMFNAVSVLGGGDKKLVSQFFINSAGNLSVFVMLLVGLKIDQRPPAGTE